MPRDNIYKKREREREYVGKLWKSWRCYDVSEEGRQSDVRKRQQRKRMKLCSAKDKKNTQQK
jgi:hypothetical protein